MCVSISICLPHSGGTFAAWCALQNKHDDCETYEREMEKDQDPGGSRVAICVPAIKWPLRGTDLSLSGSLGFCHSG